MAIFATIIMICSLFASGFVLGVISVFKYPHLLVRLHLLEKGGDT